MISSLDSYAGPGKFILGLNYSGAHDTSVAVVAEDGTIVFACALERLSRVKQDGRLPDPLLEHISWDRVDAIAIPTDEYAWSPLDPRSVLHPQPLVAPRSDFLFHGPEFYEYIATLPAPKRFICHQLSHAASTFWMSGFEEALCLTYDGGMCNSPWFGGLYRANRKDGIQPLVRFPRRITPRITTSISFSQELLGFPPTNHRGKIPR